MAKNTKSKQAAEAKAKATATKTTTVDTPVVTEKPKVKPVAVATTPEPVRGQLTQFIPVDEPAFIEPAEPVAAAQPVLEPSIIIPGRGQVFVPPGNRLVGVKVYHNTDLLATLSRTDGVDIAKSTHTYNGRVFHIAVDFVNKTYTLMGAPLRLLPLLEPIE